VFLLLTSLAYAGDFAFEGTHLSCTLVEFQRQHPNNVLYSVESVGENFWQREQVYGYFSTRTKPSAIYSFYRGRLCKIEAHFTSKEAAEQSLSSNTGPNGRIVKLTTASDGALVTVIDTRIAPTSFTNTSSH